MVKYLLQRPVAVLVSFAVCILAGSYLATKVPVSLLPDADIPRIIIRADYPNTPAPVIEESILKPIRNALATLPHLEHMESKAGHHNGTIYLQYEYGTPMDLAVIEVNEKLDRVQNALPRDMVRPQVMRLNITDVPVIRIQVIPQHDSSTETATAVTRNLLKRRLEQLPGVSMVDMNGRSGYYIGINPNEEQLKALGLPASSIESTIRQANTTTGNLSLRNGQFRYFVRISNSLPDAAAVRLLPVMLPGGGSVPLYRVATVDEQPIPTQGYHLYNEKTALVLTVRKTAGSRLNDVLDNVKNAVTQFSNEFPQLRFQLTRDQSFLLDAGISNLQQDLLYGGLATILLLFAFLGNWRSPLIMSISIPVSLLLTFVLFKAFGISFNIISLSGLTLGIGTLIDNTIVVTDHIIRRRRTGTPVMNAAIEGTNEVMIPVLGQVLTTVAVYAPLVIMGGLTAMLMEEQGIALTISLGVSLTVAFILAPLLYTFLFRNKTAALKEDTLFYNAINRGYHRMIDFVIRHRRICMVLTIMMMPVGLWIIPRLPVQALPPVEKTETIVRIDWNEPLNAEENRNRTLALMQALAPGTIEREAETGIRQFLFQDENNDYQNSELYFRCADDNRRKEADSLVAKWFAQHYPQALYALQDADNAFTQLFRRQQAYIEVKFRPQGIQREPEAVVKALIQKLPFKEFRYGDAFASTPAIELVLHRDRLIQYGVAQAAIESKLNELFGRVTISEIRRPGNMQYIQLHNTQQTLHESLQSFVAGSNNQRYPLHLFLSWGMSNLSKFITADKAGPYWSIAFDKGNPEAIEKSILPLARQAGIDVQTGGSFLYDRQQINRLWLVFGLVVLLLYFILALQYESLTQPLLVMLTLPLGVSGALLLLYFTGSSLNIMAGVGFIIVLGLIVDDPILKIETLNGLEKKYRFEGLPFDDQLLKKMIHEAGNACLKPLLLVSLTTSIAMVPVLLIPGVGNDLQQPMALVVIGGLSIGTFFTSWFIPLAYWYSKKWQKKKRTRKK